MRVLCPDRPGIGLSDPKPDRTIAGYADDVEALADALGLGRFAVLGASSGRRLAGKRQQALRDTKLASLR